MKKYNLFIIIIFYSIDYIYSASVIHRPVQRGIIGVPTLIEASLDTPQEYLWANLFVKTPLTGIYFRIPMSGSGSYFSAEIPSQYSILQGTSYYIEVTLQNGVKNIFPSNAPAGAFDIKNEPASVGVGISILEPQPGTKYKFKHKPKLLATIRGLQYFAGQEKIKVFLDSKPIFPKIEFGFIEQDFKNIQLSPGKHDFKIELYNQLGNLVAEEKVIFEVTPEQTNQEKLDDLEEKLKEDNSLSADEAKADKKIDTEEDDSTWKSSGSLGGTYQFSKTQSEQPTSLPYPNGYYNATGQFKAEKKGTSFYVGPLTWTSQNVEVGQRKNQYSFGMVKGPLTLSFNGAGKLGLDAIWNALPNEKKRGYKVQLSASQTRIPVEKDVDPNKQGIYAQSNWSGSIAFTPFDNFAHFSSNISYTLDDKKSIKSFSTIPSIKNITSTSTSKFFIPTDYMQYISLSYSFTHNILESFVLDPNSQLLAIENATSGHGVKLQTGGNIKQINTNYTIGLQLTAPTYYSGPSSTKGSGGGGDSISANTTLSHSGLFKGKIQLSENFTFTRDNLAKQKLSTTYSYAAGQNLNITIGGYWPTLTFTDQVQYQTNTGNPNRELKQISNSFTASTGYTFSIVKKKLTTSFSYSQNDSWDKSLPTGGDQIRASSYSPGISSPIMDWLNLSFNYNFSVDQNITKNQINKTSAENMSATFTMLNGKLSIPFTFSHTKSFNNQEVKTADPDTYNYTFGISGNHWKQSLNLSGSVSQLIDKINPRSNYLQYSITVSYNLIL